MIKNNKNRIDKELFTEIEGETKITHFTAMDGDNEPIWVAGRIKTLHHAGIEYRDIAILYRSNYLSRGLEKALLDAHSPYRIYGGVRFYDRAEIKDALSYLRLMAPGNEEDEKELFKNLAVKRVINSPKRGIGAKTLELIEAQAQQDDTNMYEVLRRYEIGKGKAKASIEEFVRVIEQCKALLEDISIDQLLEKVLEDSGYLAMLQEDKEIERLENIKELINDIADYVEANPDGSLQDYLQEISLYTDKEEENRGEFVQLMTIHAAKGLEFDNVFVYSLCEGIFPNEKSVIEGGNESLEEERRLAYVAFTRARKQLFLSDSHGYSFILDKIKTTSRFIAEIPEEYLEDVSSKPKNPFDQGTSRSANDFFRRGQQTAPNVEFDDMVQHAFDDFPGSKQPEVEKPKKKGKIRKGDLVNHVSFGDGVVIKLEGDLAVIAFDQKFGIRKITTNHPSLTKK